ncbi:hypothetical protein B7494_g983 [Chlorociboria aeruginascens]|nr:hypothetical protein B7494_g983 [Chlorociboria aeruginascens]
MAVNYRYNIIVTGASSGFGLLMSQELALAGHNVYAGVREHETAAIASQESFAKSNNVDLHWILLDVTSDTSVENAVKRVITEAGQIDVLIHNAGHMSYGVAEAFTIDQLSTLFEVNVFGTQRLNRAVLPHMRRNSQNPSKAPNSPKGGLIIWTGSSSTRGGVPPYFGPYFAAKAAMDAMAISYAGELSLWAIETTILVPGSYTTGTNHFQDGMKPKDIDVVDEYEGKSGPYHGISSAIMEGLARMDAPDADAADVARAVVKIVGTAPGERPLRVHVNADSNGAQAVNDLADREREELMQKCGLESLLKTKFAP